MSERACESVQDQDDVFIPLPDGTRLAARIWRPTQGVHPAILEFIPYRKRDTTLPRDETIHPWMAAQGYACLRVDIRGHGDSKGDFDDEYSPRELQDACDVIAWIAAQDWCSGTVGMMGKSWGAFNSLQVAALNPPALKAVVKVCGTVDRFNDDIHYKGGCLLGENFAWGSLMLSYTSRPADPLLRPDWREDFRQRIEQMPHPSEIWSSHQSRDDYWKHGSVCEDFGAIGSAVLSIGGWNDGYMNAPAALVQNAPMAKAIVGPWVHQYPHTAVPGPQIDFLSEMKTWWDHWLKGHETEVPAWPDYRVYMLDSAPPDASAAHRPGTWLAESLPSPRVTPLTLALGAQGQLGGDGSADCKVATPQTLGLSAGEYFPMGLNAEMAGDQRFDDAQSVCFDCECPDGLALMGAADLELDLSCDAPFGHIFARLCDVAPDGASTRIAHGMLNLRHRTDQPAAITPGADMSVRVVLDQMAYRLAPGHKLRLALSTTYWPFVWPAPEIFCLTLNSGTLTLPVHDGKAQVTVFNPAPPVPPTRLRELSGETHGRRVEIDQLSGVQTLTIEHDSGLRENPDHGLRTHDTMREIWSIHPNDPLSAEVNITWTQSFERDDWRVTTRIETRQTGDADALIMTAKLTAELSEEGHKTETVTRNFAAHVPRVHV